MKTIRFIQNYTQRNLPENVKAKLGKGKIQEITYSPNSNLLAVASSTGIWLYDTDTDEEINLLTEHKHTTSVSFSPNGRILASARAEEVQLWNVKTGKHIKTLTGHRNGVKSLSFSGNKLYRIGIVLPKSLLSFSSNGLVLANSAQGLVWLWDMKTGEHINTLIGHTDSIHSITFSPDSGILASGSEDNTLRLWNIKTGECLKILTGHRDWVSSVLFCGNSRILASASYDNTVRLWDIKTGEHINTLTGHTAPVTDTSFIEGNHCLASTSYDGTVRLWDVKTGKHIKTLTGHTGLVLGVSYNRSREILASASVEEVRLWDRKTGKHIKTFTGYSSDVRSLSFSADDHILASASTEAVRLWDRKTGKHIKTLTGPGFCLRIAFSNDGSILAITGNDRSGGVWLRLWDVKTGKHIKTVTGHSNNVEESLSFSADDHILASASAEAVRLWDRKTGKHIKTFTEPRDCLGVFSKSVSFTKDNSILAAGSMGREVWLWDVKTGKRINTLIHRGWVSNVSFGSDGSVLSSIANREVQLWDVKTGTHIKSFTHTDHVDRVRFSSDSCTLATRTNYGRKVQLWDVKTGTHIKTLIGHTDEITDIIFNSNGRTLATGSRDGTVLLWDLDFVQNKTIFAEENAEFQIPHSEIRQICEERDITTLVHFTRIKNLRNILHEGLLDHQSLLKKHGQQFIPNDQKRLDGHKEAICLSISFPNYLLFSKFNWSDNDSQPDYSGWIVLLLDAKVLWELDCAFCQENAASNAVRYIPLEERKKPDALKGMFVDVCRDTKGYVYQRQSLRIPDHHPTHPQAEVLVFDQIQSNYIKEVHFYDESTLKQWCDNNPWINPERLLHNQQYFQYGRDQVVWQDDNLDDDDILF